MWRINMFVKHVEFEVSAQEIESWYQKMKQEYQNNPVKALIEMLENTTEVMKLLRDSPNSKTTLGLFNSCIQCNIHFLEQVEE